MIDRTDIFITTDTWTSHSKSSVSNNSKEGCTLFKGLDYHYPKNSMNNKLSLQQTL